MDMETLRTIALLVLPVVAYLHGRLGGAKREATAFAAGHRIGAQAAQALIATACKRHSEALFAQTAQAIEDYLDETKARTP